MESNSSMCSTSILESDSVNWKIGIPVDPVLQARSQMDSLKSNVARLREERQKAVSRIEEIDDLLAEMGEFAKPRRGRPRKSKEKGIAIGAGNTTG
jgi:hypothetical protein